MRVVCIAEALREFKEMARSPLWSKRRATCHPKRSPKARDPRAHKALITAASTFIGALSVLRINLCDEFSQKQSPDDGIQPTARYV